MVRTKIFSVAAVACVADSYEGVCNSTLMLPVAMSLEGHSPNVFPTSADCCREFGGSIIGVGAYNLYVTCANPDWRMRLEVFPSCGWLRGGWDCHRYPGTYRIRCIVHIFLHRRNLPLYGDLGSVEVSVILLSILDQCCRFHCSLLGWKLSFEHVPRGYDGRLNSRDLRWGLL